MSYDFADMLDLAQRLATSRPVTESHCRTAVSRAYYAAYHTALARWRAAHGPVPSGPASGSRHRDLQEAMIASREWRTLGRVLRRLHRQRIVADYDSTETVSPASATAAIRECQTILRAARANR